MPLLCSQSPDPCQPHHSLFCSFLCLFLFWVSNSSWYPRPILHSVLRRKGPWQLPPVGTSSPSGLCKLISLLTVLSTLWTTHLLARDKNEKGAKQEQQEGNEEVPVLTPTRAGFWAKYKLEPAVLPCPPCPWFTTVIHLVTAQRPQTPEAAEDD